MTPDKPVLILQHLDTDGPAYLAQWLAERGIAADVRHAQAAQASRAYPDHLRGHSALAILGGEMSANDPLPSLRQAEALFLEAVRDGVPTLGHCLGGQLMARALGAKVGASPAPEVGWQRIDVAPSAQAQAWFGDATRPVVYQWHYEAFELPPGAQWLAGNAACANQAMAIGPHLGMQFHIELDLEKHERWADDQGARYLDALRSHPGTVHEGARMRRDAMAHLAAHQALAARIYQRWIGLACAR